MARKRHTPFRKNAFKLKLKQETVYSISVVFLIGLALLTALSFTKKGIVLLQINILLTEGFGWTAIFLPLVLVVVALMFTKFKLPVNQPNTLIGLLLVATSLGGVTRAGVLGQEVWFGLGSLITNVGAAIVLLSGAIVGVLIFFNISLEQIFEKLGSLFSPKQGGLSPAVVKPTMAREGPIKIQRPENQDRADKQGATKTAQEPLLPSTMANVSGREVPWQYPPLSLLSDTVPGGKADAGDPNANAAIIEKTLESFGIRAHVMGANIGPAVAQYELEVATGTKLSKLTALSSDLALALAAPHGSIRIEAPIPGRNRVGIELPHRTPEFVSLKGVLESESMKHMKSKIAVSLGLDVSGKPLAADIGKMPHVLIAGATGSGKSVCINAFIMSMLFRASPEELKFIMVDPKRVELTQYNGIPHLYAPVIVEPKEVVSALKWAIKEMEARYKKFAEVGVRNIEGFNELSAFQALPYLVIIIDELADVMLFAPAEVEDSITRIAQMARATGIHLVVSTQRPSVDVITGLIKANIPCRIAFAVSSLVDSRVIIDQPGAEKLLGRGDMLYIAPDQAKPTRIQGAFVSDSEINKVIEFIKKQGVAPEYTPAVTSLPVSIGGKRMSMGGEEIEDRDEKFDEAVRLICQTKTASASYLQRKLSLGYARAARLLDQLQAAGVVGPGEGSKPREILVRDAEEFLSRFNGAGEGN